MTLIVEDLFGNFQGDHPFSPVKTAQTCCAAGQVLPETEAWGRGKRGDAWRRTKQGVFS